MGETFLEEYVFPLQDSHLYFSLMKDEDEEASTLKEAIKEMMSNNQRFIDRVLKNLLDNYEKKIPRNNVLAQHLFPELRLQELLDLHEDFGREMEKVKVSYIEIGSVFKKLQDRYLVFCLVTSKVDLMRQFLADQMANNEDIKKLVENLENSATGAFVNAREDLSGLITTLAIHHINVKNLLEAIVRYAEKEGHSDISHETSKAVFIMKNIALHTNKYSEDCLHIETMKNLKNTIRDFPDNVELHHFGYNGVKEFRLVEMKSLDGQDSYKNYQLIVFNRYMVALELYTEEEVEDRPYTFWPTIRRKSRRRFSRHYKITEFDDISPPTQKESNRSRNWIVEFKAFTNLRIDGKKSLSFRFAPSKEEEAQLFKKYFDGLKDKIDSEIVPNRFHRDHEGVRWRKEISEDYSEHKKCGHCNTFLWGKLQTGIHCVTCNQVYHVECFTTDISIPEEEEVVVDTRIIPIKHQDDFDIGVVSREVAEEILLEKNPGTFLLRFSLKKRMHVISRMLEDDTIEHITVEQIKVGDVMFYSLKPGQGRRSLLLMVEKHRLDCELFIPINSSLAGATAVQISRQNSLCSGDQVEPEKPKVPGEEALYVALESEDEVQAVQVKSVDNNHSLRETVLTEDRFHEFNHGNISRYEAEDYLSNEVEGTFLVRECEEGGLRLSRVPHRFGNQARHFIIHRDRMNCYYLTSRQKFPKMEDLVSFYQNVENSDKYWLGAPLYTKKALDKKKERNLTDDQVLEHRENSRRLEPSSLPFYHGTMCNDVASDLLMRESPGTFLVWKVINTDQLYLSYKTVKTKKILHSKINFTDDSNCFIADEEFRSTSIRRLVENLKVKAVLTIGLTQLSRFPTISTNSSVDLGDLDIGDLDMEDDEEDSPTAPIIPYVSKEETENKLRNSPLGTWMLRTNKEGQVRVSFVSNASSTKVKHKQLFRHGGELFTMTEAKTESPVTLLEIIIKLKEQRMITRRLIED